MGGVHKDVGIYGEITVETIPLKEYNIKYSFMNKMEENMVFISTSEIAEKWKISRRRVSALCREGRIKGAIFTANTWLVPENAEKPIDPRKKDAKDKFTKVRSSDT